MNAATRLLLYAAALAALFGASFVVAGAVVPESAVRDAQVDDDQHGADQHGADQHGADQHGADQHGADQHGSDQHGSDQHGSDQHGSDQHGSEDHAAGLTMASDGLLLESVTAPRRADEPGTLSLVVSRGAEPLTDFEMSHERRLHLIVVRTDGRHFRHVHPVMADDGTWSAPWSWSAAGTHRVYADFVPAGGDPVTLSRTVEVAGTTPAAPPPPVDGTVAVAGYQVSVDGALVAGEVGTLRFTVTQDGRPVTSLQPYLGAYGHLVTLREGDLAFLHGHPEGESASVVPGSLAGPAIDFAVEVPSAGRYLLHLDLRIDGRIVTAPFVLEATA